ncbi:MAG: hypothetical protein KZQ83_19705 [gamma proteobacterium symbiont of Taylorina sp.]|nr:hypothetical protein [gamma proteobacterium symbiont of Taylorina sp.]
MIKKKPIMILAAASVAAIAITLTISSTSEKISDKTKTISEIIIDSAIPKIEKAMMDGKYKAITIRADKEMEMHIQSRISPELPFSYETLTGDSDSVVFVFHSVVPNHLVKQNPQQVLEEYTIQETETEVVSETDENVSTKFDFEFYPTPAAGGMIVDEVMLLEERAQVHIKENRLSTPKDNCAMSIVALIEAQGGDASSLRDQVGNRYLVLAKDRFNKGDSKKGNIYADQAIVISTNLTQSAEQIKAYGQSLEQEDTSKAVIKSVSNSPSSASVLPIDESTKKQNGFF